MMVPQSTAQTTRRTPHALTAFRARAPVLFLEDLSNRPYQARHLFAYLSKFFRWAIAQRSYGLSISPCAGLSAKDLFGKPSHRTRILNNSELAPLWQAT